MPNQGAELWKSVGSSHWLVTGWLYALRQVLESLSPDSGFAGITFNPVAADNQAWAQWTSPTWCQMPLEAIPGAAISVGCPQPTVQMLAGVIAGDMALAEAECQGTFLEVVNQVVSSVGDAISARLKKRVSFSQAQVGECPAGLDYAIQIEFPHQGVTHMMALIPNQELMQGVGGVSDPSEITPAAPASPVASAKASAGAAGNLELLLEVELPVSVTFGRTQLPLKDVLKLSSGSIVELNRLVNEPVEVVINNCVIARGEVVVVEGNYGVRVTEIVSRQERIRSIL